MEDGSQNLDVTFEKISGAIGSLMLLWAAIDGLLETTWFVSMAAR